MRIQRAWINNYVDGLEKVSKANVQKLYKALETLDADSPRLIKDVTAIMQMICQYSCAEASVLAAGLYDVIHEAELGYSYGAEAISSYNPKATAIATAAIVREGLTDRARTDLARRISYEIKKSAGECVKSNVLHESRMYEAYGKLAPSGYKRVKPRYARVPGTSEHYADGCPFCKMLASRGYVYHSPETAGDDDHYHPDCRCTVIPSFAKTDIPGYDPDRYYNEWMNHEAGVAQRQAEREGREVEEVVQERLDRREYLAALAKKKRKEGIKRGTRNK